VHPQIIDFCLFHTILLTNVLMLSISLGWSCSNFGLKTSWTHCITHLPHHHCECQNWRVDIFVEISFNCIPTNIIVHFLYIYFQGYIHDNNLFTNKLLAMLSKSSLLLDQMTDFNCLVQKFLTLVICNKMIMYPKMNRCS
jgi:hypothetical protein